MVTKSFGKRNFMQPMGRPKHALKVPCFFFFLSCFGVGGGGGIFFFNFSQIPNVFALCSLQVPTMFPNFAMFSSFSIPPHFYPTYLGKWRPPFTCIGGPKGRNCILQK
jgi:hypothetical protein